jgi:hypothetical protein
MLPQIHDCAASPTPAQDAESSGEITGDARRPSDLGKDVDHQNVERIFTRRHGSTASSANTLTG